MSSLAPTRPAEHEPTRPERAPGRPFLGVLRWQLRNARRAPLTWGVSLGLLCALEVAIYPSVEDSMTKVLDEYPEPLREAFNITEISTVEAFLDMEMFSLLLPLAIGFFAIRQAIRALVLAEDAGWLDVILTTPLSRRTLAAAGFAGTAISTAVVLLVIGALTELAGLVAGASVSPSDLLMGLAAMWALAMLFAGVAVLASGLVRRGVIVTALASGTLLTMYVVDLVGKLAESLGDLRYVSAFHYTESAMVEGLDLLSFVALTAIAIGLTALGAWRFDRRDIQ